MEVKSQTDEGKLLKRNKIVHYDEAHDWVKDNEYLRTGHRVNFDSFVATLKSLFMRHNETLNIWIHLVGVIIFLLLLRYIFIDYSHASSKFKKVKDEFSESTIAQKFSEISKDLFSFVSKESQEIHHWYDEFMEKLNFLKSERGTYFYHLKQIFQEKEISFINSFDAKVSKLSSNFNKVIDKFMEELANSQYNIHNVKYFIENCFSEEHFQKTLFYSFHGSLEFYPIIIFIICAIICLSFSTIFHWFHILNPTVYKILHKLDYAGISFLNFGSSYGCYFYYFYCSPYLFRIFAWLIFIACLAVFIVSMTDYMDRPENTTKKGLMYGGLGISNVLPACFMAYLMFYATEDSHFIPLEKSFFGLAFMGALYLIGLAFYITKFPEKEYPGKFDIVCNSHNIWHVFVFAAAAQHLLNLIWLYNVRTEYPCKSCIIS